MPYRVMRYWRHAIVSLPLLFGALPAHAQGIGWQEAVARLAAERTRAETCVRLLKRHGDEGAESRGELTYGDAKAEVDAVIGGLTVALAEDGEPESLPDFEARLERGVKGLDEVCQSADSFVPDASGEKAILVPILVAALPPLIVAMNEIYLDYREEDRLTRLTIQNQLEATKWPAFADVSVSD